MKALVGAFNQEKALVGAFSVIVQPVVETMDRFTALEWMYWRTSYLNCHQLELILNIYKYLQISTQVFVLLLSLLHTTLSDPNTFNLPHDAVDFRWVDGR